MEYRSILSAELMIMAVFITAGFSKRIWNCADLSFDWLSSRKFMPFLKPLPIRSFAGFCGENSELYSKFSSETIASFKIEASSAYADGRCISNARSGKKILPTTPAFALFPELLTDSTFIPGFSEALYELASCRVSSGLVALLWSLPEAPLVHKSRENKLLHLLSTCGFCRSNSGVLAFRVSEQDLNKEARSSRW